MEEIYRNQVILLLDVLPEVAKESCFALHGGTAINLFIRNMPRLSVDIDLTYLLVKDREITLQEIKAALIRIKTNVLKNIAGSSVTLKAESGKLLISTKQATVKLEVSLMNRGIYGQVEVRTLCDKAQNEYESFCEIGVVPLGQLYGGKICAALDRQHPRDLFDIKYLLANEGFSEEIKAGFLFCLLGAERPIHEMLNPNLLDQKSALVKQFEGMTTEVFGYKEYEEVKRELIEVIHRNLNDIDKNFLLNFKNLRPNWHVYPYADFPSVKWKIQNLKKLKDKNPGKHLKLYELLKTHLNR